MLEGGSLFLTPKRKIKEEAALFFSNCWWFDRFFVSSQRKFNYICDRMAGLSQIRLKEYRDLSLETINLLNYGKDKS